MIAKKDEKTKKELELEVEKDLILINHLAKISMVASKGNHYDGDDSLGDLEYGSVFGLIAKLSYDVSDSIDRISLIKE